MPNPPRRPSAPPASSRSARYQRDYSRWQREYRQLRPEITRDQLRLPGILAEQLPPPREEDLNREFKPRRADREQPELDRAQAEVAELRAAIAEVEAGIQEDARALPEASARRQQMRESDRARFTKQMQELEKRTAVADETLRALALAREAEEEEFRADCDALQGQVAPLTEAQAAEEAELVRLQKVREERERLAATKEREIVQLQEQYDVLEREISEADARRSLAEAEAATKRRTYGWGLLCALVLSQAHQAALEGAVLEFEALALEEEQRFTEQMYRESEWRYRQHTPEVAAPVMQVPGGW